MALDTAKLLLLDDIGAHPRHGVGWTDTITSIRYLPLRQPEGVICDHQPAGAGMPAAWPRISLPTGQYEYRTTLAERIGARGAFPASSRMCNGESACP